MKRSSNRGVPSKHPSDRFNERLAEFRRAMGKADPEDAMDIALDLPKSNPLARSLDRLMEAAIDAEIEWDEVVEQLTGRRSDPQSGERIQAMIRDAANALHRQLHGVDDPLFSGNGPFTGVAAKFG